MLTPSLLQEGIQHVAAQTESVLSTSQKQASDVKTAVRALHRTTRLQFGTPQDYTTTIRDTSYTVAAY